MRESTTHRQRRSGSVLLIGSATVLMLMLAGTTTSFATGEVVCWGDDGDGQCSVPAPNEDFMAVAGGYLHSVGLKRDGTVVAWGSNARGECAVPEPNEAFVSISAKGYHTVALKVGGSIVAWGDGNNGQCEPPDPNLGFIAAVAGGYHSLGLRPGGIIEAWGLNSSGQCDVPSPNEGYIAVAAGYYHTLALRPDGSVTAWGHNGFGQCDVPEPNSGFVAVAAGGYFSLGRKTDGSVVVWGGTGHGQDAIPEPNEDFLQVAGGAYHVVGLKDDLTARAWGRNDEGQCDLPDPNGDFTAVAAGGFHGLGLRGPRFSFQMTDVPDDQGGFLQATWTRHWDDGPSAPEPVTTYELQRLGEDWITLATIEATGSDQYEIVIETDDVLVIGEPASLSSYRVVARTADVATYFVSAVVGAVSIDNIAPPQPVAAIDAYGDIYLITWTNPDIPDYAEACVYQGSSADFVPGDPIGCTTNTGLVDEQSLWVYYRVRFFDVHGNGSEFSEVVHPVTTAVAGETPAPVELHACYPNPFNPHTTVAFSVPRSGHVELAIYDAAGRLVVRLVDETVDAGRHEYVWNGRGESGGAVPSGTYLCRLVTSWGGRSRKMSLLK